MTGVLERLEERMRELTNQNASNWTPIYNVELAALLRVVRAAEALAEEHRDPQGHWTTAFGSSLQKLLAALSALQEEPK